jgi:hypothetical protein
MSRASMYARYGGQQFGRVAPSQPYSRARPIPRTDVRYYQERAGQAQSMQKVIGTTSAPSSSHQLTGFTADGYAIWEKQAAPAPAPSGGGGGGGGGGNAAAQQLAQLTAQSEAYRKESTAALEAGKLRIAQLEDEELQRQKATELQNRLAIQSAASTARGQMGAQLKIAPASQTASTAGTAAFKRRGDRMRLAPIQTTAGINVPSGSVLNV